MIMGQRVLYQGVTGEIIAASPNQFHLYLGTYDGKRLERWVDRTEVSPTLKQQLEDLL